MNRWLVAVSGWMVCVICALAWGQVAWGQVLDAQTIIHLSSRQNMCALTFDDGPTPFTPELLNSLQEANIRATFFVLGSQVVKYPQVVQRIVAEGHEVASHGYAHSNLRKLPTTARWEDLQKTQDVLMDLGITPRYFRPPYGSHDESLVELVQSMGMVTVLWTTDSRDWKRRPAHYRNLPSALGRMQPMQGIFLFHDTRKATVRDVKRIVQDLRTSGCQRFVTVSEYFEGSVPEETFLMASRPDITTPQQTIPSPDTMPQDAIGEHISSPAGTTPIPMARSFNPWIFGQQEPVEKL